MTTPGPAPSGRPSAARFGLAGLLLLPLVELAVAIAVGRVIGAERTVLLLILLSVLGIVVLRRAGARAVRSLGPAAPAGPVIPAQARLRDAGDVAWTLLGGLLLVVPGFVTAVAGILLAAPPTRRLLRPLLGRGAGRLAARLLGGPLVGRMTGARIVEGDVVQASVVDVEVVPPTPPAPPRELPPADGPGRTDDEPGR